MAKASTPTFVTTLPLKTASYTQAILRKCFFATQKQYTALLGEEALKRLRLTKVDNRHKQACATYKKKGKKQEASALFKKLTEAYRYSGYALHAYTKQWRKKGAFLSIDASVSLQLATYVYNAVKAYKAGKRGKQTPL